MTLAIESRPDSERVVITGFDAITPLGLTVGESVAALREGKSGIVNLQEVLGYGLMDAEFFPKEHVGVGAVIQGFDPEQYLPTVELRRIHRSAQLAYATGVRTLVQAGVLKELPPPFKGNAGEFIATMDDTTMDRFGVTKGSQSLLVNVNPHRLGIGLGSGVGGSVFSADIEDTLLYQRAKRILKGVLEDAELEIKLEEIFSGEGRQLSKRSSPYWILQVLPDRPVDVLANKVGARGPGKLYVLACASGLTAMGESYDDIVHDEADFMLTGGIEGAMERIGYSSFATMRALNITDDPLEASIPFFGGEGFVMAEGTGTFGFERMSHALARNTRIYGEVLGWTTRLDGHDDTSPRPGGEGAVITMRLTLEKAGIDPNEVELVSTHGTSTKIGDLAELLALMTVFGEDKIKNLPVLSTKGWHGHSLGASGAMELAIAMGLAQAEFLPSNWNPNEKPPIQEGVELLLKGRDHYSPKIILKNSFGFGGKNTSMVISVWPQDALAA